MVFGAKTLSVVSVVSAVALYAGQAVAGSPTVLLGLSFDFGANPKENIGLTAKIISNNDPNHFIVGAGGTYFPFSKDQFGLDLSGGYVVDHAAVTAGYDVLRWTPQVSVGWVPTR